MKKLPQYTSIGSYTILYTSIEGARFCAECASKEPGQLESSTYDEGPSILCDVCGIEIDSSYGSEDATT